MSKHTKTIGWLAIAAFIFIQFFQPQKNNSGFGRDHILLTEDIPVVVKGILENSCFDCHSDKTKYPWFDRIAPASWLVAHHIKEGKEKLNFSEWGKKEISEKIGSVIDIQEEIKSGKMPLDSYAFMHRKARLTAEQVKIMIRWTEEFSDKLLQAEK